MVFPRFERAHKLVELVRVLRAQHQAGRKVTERVQGLATAAALKDRGAAAPAARELLAFIRMYEPHASREDTVLFPALHEIVSPSEYDALGEDFERREHQSSARTASSTPSPRSPQSRRRSASRTWPSSPSRGRGRPPRRRGSRAARALLEAGEDRPGGQRDHDRRHVDDRAAAEHERRAGDRAGRRGRHAVDERLARCGLSAKRRKYGAGMTTNR